MPGVIRGSFIRMSVALAAGLMLGACGGEALEGEVPEASAEGPTASYIPRCDGTRAWIINYYNEASPPQEVGRLECTCQGVIYRYGTTFGDSQLFYENYCNGL